MRGKKFFSSLLGMTGFVLLALFVLAGVYAPLLASSKPLAVKWEGVWYFPWFRYLIFTGFYTKPIDLFFNLMMFTLPLGLIAAYFKKGMWVMGLQFAAFFFLWFFPVPDPALDSALLKQKEQALLSRKGSGWDFDLQFLSPYGRLNLITESIRNRTQNERIEGLVPKGFVAYTPYRIENEMTSEYYQAKKRWLSEQKVDFILWPLIREFHWQDDAGGDQSLNRQLPWWELTRINRKDLIASLLFGIRISLMVGVLGVFISLLIGMPLGALAGYFGGKVDLVISRFIEIWEGMPAFFMLLLVVAITQSKSIFIVIAVIGVFGWTTFARYLRGEFLKERSLPYVEACRVMGFSPLYTMFHHILPNACPPILTLLPFAILGAITSEAGLSFLGLGEENSPSWGVLMDEGRQAFPAESNLLWPPALLLTILLIAIALVGDALRDALDPRS